MRDLENRIAGWRRELSAAHFREDVLDELEAHLRDEMDALLLSGRSPDQAFREAAARFGPVTVLGTEFGKLEERAGTEWAPVRVVTILGVVGLLAWCALWAVKLSGQRKEALLLAHVLGLTVGYVGAYFLGALGCCYTLTRVFHDLSPGQKHSLKRSASRFASIVAAFTAVGLVLGILWAKDHLGRYWNWDPRETGALLVLICGTGIALGGRLPRLGVHSVMLLTLLGSIVTTMAWFGARVLDVGFDASARPGRTALLVALGVQALFVAVSFLPANCLSWRKPCTP